MVILCCKFLEAFRLNLLLTIGVYAMSVMVNAGTIMGPHHQLRGEDNQDAFQYLVENGWGVVAVADGAGSLSASHIGAKIAASTSVNESMDALNSGCSPEEAVVVGIESARDALLARDDYRKTGCTLALGVLTENGWATGVVGDAFTVLSYGENNHIIIRPDSVSEFANITKLLTSKDYGPRYASGSEELIALSVSSDGLDFASLKDGEPSSGFWNPMINRALEGDMDIQSFLYHMQDKEKIVDDTTLAIMTRIK